jgi:hypothetical protein
MKLGDAIAEVKPFVQDPHAFVVALTRLGLLKLEETPKDPTEVLSNLVIHASSADSTGWMIGPFGASQIIEALKKAGFMIAGPQSWPTGIVSR